MVEISANIISNIIIIYYVCIYPLFEYGIIVNSNYINKHIVNLKSKISFEEDGEIAPKPDKLSSRTTLYCTLSFQHPKKILPYLTLLPSTGENSKRLLKQHISQDARDLRIIRDLNRQKWPAANPLSSKEARCR